MEAQADALPFVVELLNTGGALVKIVDELADGLAANGSEEEEPAHLIVGVLAGAVATRLTRVPQADFVRAAELMELAMDAVLAELRLAEQLARRRAKAQRHTTTE
jgi:hypothetical protein